MASARSISSFASVTRANTSPAVFGPVLGTARAGTLDIAWLNDVNAAPVTDIDAVLREVDRLAALALATSRDLDPGSGSCPGLWYVTDPAIRAAVREALTRHLGLDIPAERDAPVASGEPAQPGPVASK